MKKEICRRIWYQGRGLICHFYSSISFSSIFSFPFPFSSSFFFFIFLFHFFFLFLHFIFIFFFLLVCFSESLVTFCTFWFQLFYLDLNYCFLKFCTDRNIWTNALILTNSVTQILVIKGTCIFKILQSVSDSDRKVIILFLQDTERWFGRAWAETTHFLI